jgi:hypothetical protein
MFTRLWSAGSLMERRDVLKGAGFALAAMAQVPAFLRAAPAPGLADTMWKSPLLLPKPREMKIGGGHFVLDNQTALLLPSGPSAGDLHLSRCLMSELSDWYDLVLRPQQAEQVPATGRFVLMGSVDNPLIRQHCSRLQLRLDERAPGPEGYLLHVDETTALIAGGDARGTFYGLQSLRQLIRKSGQQCRIPTLDVKDWPDKPFRGVKLYVPSRTQIPFFKRFIRDFMALYKYNTLMMEMNACMRLDRHPELNAGWVEMGRDTNFSRKNYPPGVPHDMESNSSHHDAADGGFLEKDEVADLVHWVERHHIEVVPEVPSLTHAYYLLSKHRELSQVPDVKWPDTYCACDPRSYELLFDVMDEYVEVMKPRMVHAGHDEWFAPFGLGECCKDRDPGEVYGEDIRKVHGYLTNKGIRMAIWGDYLLERVRGKGLQKRSTPDGFKYHAPGAMTPEQVRALVPKDILIFNWFWSEEEGGETTEAQLDEFGFRQIYGNMTPFIEKYGERSKRSTIIGGAPSSWAATTEYNMCKDLLRDVVGCSSLLWSKQPLEARELSRITQARMPEARPRLTGQVPPSATGDAVVPVDISSWFNGQMQEPTLGVDLSGLRTGRVVSGNFVFDLGSSHDGNQVVIVGTEGQKPNPLPREVGGIKIGVDATSLVFLHACAIPATNKEAYRLIWDFADSADLLGWYEVAYEDGLPDVIPVRYGINILEWNWGASKSVNSYCYGADVVHCGQGEDSPVTFFAMEWTSPRLGKAIREVRLKGSSQFRGAVPGFENAFGEVIPNNAVLLKAISYTRARG